jgi:hypothetical protein
MNFYEFDGLLILGLVLVSIAASSGIRGLYCRSSIPFLARPQGADGNPSRVVADGSQPTRPGSSPRRAA